MRQKKEKRKLKIVYDIIPPHLLRDVILVEKKVSKMVKVAYLFLKTSKYGSAVLIVGVAVFGGALIMGFSPKTEITEIYPAQYEGDWQRMEMALDKKLSDQANILEFNHNNSAGIIKFGEEVYGEFSNTEEETDQVEDTEPAEEEEKIGIEEPVQIGDTEPTEEEKENTEDVEEETDIIISLPDKETDMEKTKEDPAQDIEPVEDNETKDEDDKTKNDKVEAEEELSFFRKTKNLFFIPEARAEETEKTDEINESATDETNEDVAIKEEETVQVGDIEPIEEIETEEKFEDYAGIIIVPDVDGNLFSEQEDSATKEMTEVIFTKEFSAVYSGFFISDSEKNGALKKIRAGFSFASIGEENEDDEIIILWSSNNQDWNTVSEFTLNKNYSNKNNGDYFYTDFFDLSDLNEDEILRWEDLKNIKIKFSYLTNNNEADYVSLFLDAVWIETESKKTDEKIAAEEKIKFLSQKKNFKINENPEFEFIYRKEKKGLLNSLLSITEKLGVTDYWKDIKVTAEIICPDKKNIGISDEEFGNLNEIFTLNKNGGILMKLNKNQKFKPGLYRIILKIEEQGEIQIFEQDFTWGVLAINVNKSIYLSGEEAYLQMGVLKDDGHTVCDADLELRIMNYESGTETILSTENGTIMYSGQCDGNNVTDAPDYFAYYTTGEAGVYEMKLTNLDNGYEIIDSFEVRESVPFDIERIGPSRIYPPADYGMVLKIKANQDFKGFIQEKVPASFEIINQELKIKNQETGELEIHNGQFITQDEDNTKLLRWHDIDLKQGDEVEIKYGFDAPDVSPDLHLLGPLGFYE